MQKLIVVMIWLSLWIVGSETNSRPDFMVRNSIFLIENPFGYFLPHNQTAIRTLKKIRLYDLMVSGEVPSKENIEIFRVWQDHNRIIMTEQKKSYRKKTRKAVTISAIVSGIIHSIGSSYLTAKVMSVL